MAATWQSLELVQPGQAHPQLPHPVADAVLLSAGGDVVDELADLMMLASRDVEVGLTRLAQMARAAGIRRTFRFDRPADYESQLDEVLRGPGSVLVEVAVVAEADVAVADDVVSDAELGVGRAGGARCR